MGTVLEILAKIRLRPSMYLGGDDEDRASQLRNINFVLLGYDLAVRLHGFENPHLDTLERVAKRLRAERGWSMSRGPIEAIIEHSPTGEDAWNLFWTMVEQEGRG